MIGELRRICRAHKLQTGRHGTQLFLGRTPGDPFYPSTIRLRALKAWGWKQVPNPNPGSPQKLWIKDRARAARSLPGDSDRRGSCARLGPGSHRVQPVGADLHQPRHLLGWL